MKRNLYLILILIFSNCAFAQMKDYPIANVPFTKVKLTDNFWLPRIKTNHTVTIPASFERCENTGRIKNFEMAAAKKGEFCTIFPFDDTDIYKTIEGASFSLNLNPDKKLETYIDSLIVKIAKAQEPDGYLYTARTIDPLKPHKWAGKERWEKERELSHELYNSGHLYEAAAAHYQATGKKTLLNIALKNADLVCSVFGQNKNTLPQAMKWWRWVWLNYIASQERRNTSKQQSILLKSAVTLLDMIQQVKIRLRTELTGKITNRLWSRARQLATR